MIRAVALSAVWAVLVGSTSPAGAQQAVAGVAPWQAPGLALPDGGPMPAPPEHNLTWPADSLERIGDYRWEGAGIGALVVGTLGAVLGASIEGPCPTVPGAQCDNGGGLGDALLAGTAGAVSGGLLGFLVGRLSPKYAAAPSPSAAR